MCIQLPECFCLCFGVPVCTTIDVLVSEQYNGGFLPDYYYYLLLFRHISPIYLSNPWSQSARSIPSVPKLKLMASRHQKKNTRTRRRGNLHHGVRKKGVSNYSSTNPLKSKFRRATSDYLDTALLLRCCIHELPAVTIRKMPSQRQCGNGISHAESSQ